MGFLGHVNVFHFHQRSTTEHMLGTRISVEYNCIQLVLDFQAKVKFIYVLLKCLWIHVGVFTFPPFRSKGDLLQEKEL